MIIAKRVVIQIELNVRISNYFKWNPGIKFTIMALSLIPPCIVRNEKIYISSTGFLEISRLDKKISF